nr:hypothetical protein BaRGS_019094 [Batillaria attramentaria]
MVELITYIRGLTTVKEKVAPFVMDKSGTFTVPIDINISVVSVLAVDDIQQTVTTMGFLTFLWADTSLAWDETDYRVLEAMQVPKDMLWTPPVRFSNSLDDRDLLNREGLMVTVYSDGTVYVDVPFITETLCGMDLTDYPFDQQTCPLYIDSYLYDVTWRVHYYRTADRAATFAVGSEWEFLNTSAMFTNAAEAVIYGPVIEMTIKRKTTFYTVCLVLPMALTSYMNTLVFLLPLQSGEKISFIVSIFVSSSVFVSLKDHDHL